MADTIKKQTQQPNVALDQFQEFDSVEIEGNFRGYWRDVAAKDDRPASRQFKMTRSVKMGDRIVRQAAWLSEADAKAHGLEDGVKYHVRLRVGTELVPANGNGNPQYRDEYSFVDPTIIEVTK